MKTNLSLKTRAWWKYRKSFVVAVIAITMVGVTGSYLLDQTKATNVNGLGVDRFGISTGGKFQYESTTEMNAQLDGMKAMGVRWIRFDVAWSQVQAGGRDSWDWARTDTVINAANAKGIKVLPILAYTPSWARPSNCTGSDKCAPANHLDFANFAKAAATRYSSKNVRHWEIWNEQNISNFWQPTPNAVAYTELLKSTYTAIKQADPQAFVVTGGFSPASTNGTNIAPVDFLKIMYDQGGKNSFDAVGHHPYCWSAGGNCPNVYAGWSAWSQMSETPESLRSVMVARGDSSKQIWATEFGAPTNGPSNQTPLSEADQATMVTAAYNKFASFSWAGPLFYYNYKDFGTNATNREDWFGVRRFDNTQKPSYTAYKNAATGKVGDINRDNVIDIFDLSILLSKWGTTDSNSDLNKNGVVDVFDLSILLSAWGK
jgi:polysaccharide biosynthesis protein PslG